MGKEDVAARKYLSDPERFADVFNHKIFDGEGVINPKSLREADASKIVGDTEKRRDLLKEWVIKSDGGAAYAILGLEEQTNGHLAMPVRCALYDAMAYAGQVREIFHRNKNEGMDGASSAEFLSGMWERDRLHPVATVVLYMSGSDWTWPETLHGMMDADIDDRLIRLVPDYRLNLVVPVRMSDGEIDGFSTELGLAIKYMKYSEDKERLARMVKSDKRYRSLGAETAAFLNVVTGSNLKIRQEGGKVDMCKAIDDMRAEERREGQREGLREGQREGRRLGTLDNLRSLLAHTGWELARAFDALDVPESERASLAAELSSAT